MPDPSSESRYDVKERLVAEAERLSGSHEWKRSGQRYRELRDALRNANSVGHAGDREFEKRFHAAQQHFYDNRNRERMSAKRRLLERARSLSTAGDLRAAKEQFKAMDREWRALGDGGPVEKQLLADFRRAGDAIWETDTLRRRKALEEYIERVRDRLFRAQMAYNDRLASGVDFDRRVAAMKPGPKKSAGEDRVWGINEDLRQRGARIGEMKRQLEEAQGRLDQMR